ncbi:hypothetical protein D3C85_1607880 [compost metagenome]
MVNDRALAVPVLEYVLPPMATDDEPAAPEVAAAVSTVFSVAAVAEALLVVRLPAASRKAAWPPMVTLPVASTSNSVEPPLLCVKVAVVVPVAGRSEVARAVMAPASEADLSVNVKFLFVASYV